MEKKMGVQWDSTSAICRLQESYDSVRRKELYNILFEFCIQMKVVRLIKMLLKEIYIKVCIGKHLSDAFPIQNALKQGDALSPLLFNFPIEYAISKAQENKDGLELSGTRQLLVCAHDVNLLGKTIDIVKKNTEALLYVSKEIGTEVSAKKTKYIFVSHHQTPGHIHYMNKGN
jgi:hypothetical protein